MLSSVYAHEYEQISSSQTVSYDGFQGNIIFNVNATDANSAVSHKNSYYTATLKIVQTREDGTQHTFEPIINTGTRVTPTGISVPYICQNAAQNLFSTVNCVVNKITISDVQNAQPTNTLFKLIYESKEEQKGVNSTNPINVLSDNDKSAAIGYA